MMSQNAEKNIYVYQDNLYNEIPFMKKPQINTTKIYPHVTRILIKKKIWVDITQIFTACTKLRSMRC